MLILFYALLYVFLIFLIFYIKDKYVKKSTFVAMVNDLGDGDVLINDGSGRWVPKSTEELNAEIGTAVSSEAIRFGKNSSFGAGSILLGENTKGVNNSIALGNNSESLVANGISLGNGSVISSGDPLLSITDGGDNSSLPLDIPPDSYITIKFNGEILHVPAIKMGSHYYKALFENESVFYFLSKDGGVLSTLDFGGTGEVQRHVKINGVWTPEGDPIIISGNFHSMSGNVIISYDDPNVNILKYNNGEWDDLVQVEIPDLNFRFYPSNEKYFYFEQNDGSGGYIELSDYSVHYIPARVGYKISCISMNEDDVLVNFTNDSPTGNQKVVIYKLVEGVLTEQTEIITSVLGEEMVICVLGKKYIAIYDEGTGKINIRGKSWSSIIKEYDPPYVPYMTFSEDGKLFAYCDRGGGDIYVYSEDDWDNSRTTRVQGNIISMILNNGDFTYISETSSNLVEWKKL